MTARPDARTERPGAPPAINPITVYKAWCKRCGICIAFCPKNVLERGEDGRSFPARPEDCVRCHMCELRCPDFAITVTDEEEAS